MSGQRITGIFKSFDSLRVTAANVESVAKTADAGLDAKPLIRPVFSYYATQKLAKSLRDAGTGGYWSSMKDRRYDDVVVSALSKTGVTDCQVADFLKSEQGEALGKAIHDGYAKSLGIGGHAHRLFKNWTVAVQKAGTSDGAKKGWQTRLAGGQPAKFKGNQHAKAADFQPFPMPKAKVGDTVSVEWRDRPDHPHDTRDVGKVTKRDGDSVTVEFAGGGGGTFDAKQITSVNGNAGRSLQSRGGSGPLGAEGAAANKTESGLFYRGAESSVQDGIRSEIRIHPRTKHYYAQVDDLTRTAEPTAQTADKGRVFVAADYGEPTPLKLKAAVEAAVRELKSHRQQA